MMNRDESMQESSRGGGKPTNPCLLPLVLLRIYVRPRTRIAAAMTATKRHGGIENLPRGC